MPRSNYACTNKTKNCKRPSSRVHYYSNCIIIVRYRGKSDRELAAVSVKSNIITVPTGFNTDSVAQKLARHVYSYITVSPSGFHRAVPYARALELSDDGRWGRASDLWKITVVSRVRTTYAYYNSGVPVTKRSFVPRRRLFEWRCAGSRAKGRWCRARIRPNRISAARNEFPNGFQSRPWLMDPMLSVDVEKLRSRIICDARQSMSTVENAYTRTSTRCVCHPETIWYCVRHTAHNDRVFKPRTQSAVVVNIIIIIIRWGTER